MKIFCTKKEMHFRDFSEADAFLVQVNKEQLIFCSKSDPLLFYTPKENIYD